MANDYYQQPPVKIPITTIRSGVRNDDAAAVEAGFDKLPSELDIKRTQYGTDNSSDGTFYEITVPYLNVPYYEGLAVTFQATFENIANANVSVNGQTILPIVDAVGDPIGAGNIKADQATELLYLLSPVPSFQLISTAATAQDVAAAVQAADEAAASATSAAASAAEAEAIAQDIEAQKAVTRKFLRSL